MAREAQAMSVQPTTNGEGVAKKQRRKRSASIARPAFFIIQVLDESGNPQAFDKRRIKIVSVERNAEKVLEAVESGQHDHAFYLRGIVPPGRQATPQTAQSAPQHSPHPSAV
jgi:hypothetical protein